MSVTSIPSDPLTKAIQSAVIEAVRVALDGNLPRLTVTRIEAGEMLGVSPRTVDRMVREGELTKLRTEAHVGCITLVSVFAAADWPLPVIAPTGAGLKAVS